MASDNCALGCMRAELEADNERLRERVAELEDERDIFQRTLDKRDKELDDLQNQQRIADGTED